MNALDEAETPEELLELSRYRNSWGTPGMAYFPEDEPTVEALLTVAELLLYEKRIVTPLVIECNGSDATAVAHTSDRLIVA